MTVKKPSINAIDLKTLVAEDRALMKSLMKEALQEVLEAEMTDFLGAGPHDARKAAKATGPAIMNAAWWPAPASSNCGYPGTAAASSRPPSLSATSARRRPS